MKTQNIALWLLVLTAAYTAQSMEISPQKRSKVFAWMKKRNKHNHKISQKDNGTQTDQSVQTTATLYELGQKKGIYCDRGPSAENIVNFKKQGDLTSVTPEQLQIMAQGKINIMLH